MSTIKIYAFSDEASTILEEQIAALKRNNLNGMEIRSVDNENIADISIEKAKEIKKQLDDAGLEVWSLGSPYGKIQIDGDFDGHIEKLKKSFQVAQVLGTKNIRMFSFYMPKDGEYKDYKNQVIDKLGKMAELAKENGIYLCHENEKGIYGDVAERCLEIFKAVPYLKGVFDPANFIQCGQDIKEAWDLLKDYIFYMHIKDATHEGDIVPSGAGIGNIAYIAKEFIKKGGTSFTIEPHLTVFRGLADLEQEGETSKVGQRFVYANSNEAFDAACAAFKEQIS